MTFLVPYLQHLESVDSGIAVRFSRMATLIMECCSSHPVVQMEVMAFYEMLAAHQRLLPAHTGGIKYDEHPVLCCVPFLMSNIGPSRIVDHPSGHWNRSRGSLSSSSCLRATLKVIRALSVSQVLIAEWSDMRIVSLLFAALEDTIGTRVFAGETSHRGLAAPRESEITYNGGNQTVQEITEVVRLLLYLERSLSKNCDYVLLRYILLSRCILIGNSSTDDDGDEETEEPYTVVRVVQAALGRAASDASPVLHYANPVRWQVKSLAVQVATIAIDEMVKKCGKDGLRTPSSPMFNPKLANSECLKECRRANSSQSTIPESKLALHINALVAAACNTATATVDQVELRSLQECAMHMLVKTIYCFGSMQDPDQPDLKVLHEYIPQISSCIKSALGAPNEADGEYTCRLFLVGCEALREFVCVTTEKGVLKRLARAAVPSSDEMPFFEYNSGVPSKVSKVDGSKMNANMRASLLLRIGKLWTLENIPLEDTEIKSLVEVDESEIGAHAAALAIDGASLLLSSGYSLCGSKINQDQSQNGPVESGFFYDHITDIDDSVKAALVEKWASFASLAVTSLSKTISETDLPSERRDACEVWLCKIIPFLFAGLHDSISYQTSSSTRDKTDDWARQLDSNNVASRCLQGLNTVVSTPGLLDLDEKWKPEIESSTGRLSKQILLPILSSKFGSNPRNTGTSAELIAKSCSLLESLAKNPVFGLHEDSSLLLFLLQPLNMLQSSSINLGDSHVTMIISACLVSVADIISKLNTPDSLVKAMVSLVLTVSAREKEMIPDSIKTAIQALLRECLSNNSLTTKEQCAIATEMANARDWGTWSVVVQANDGISARNSLLVIQRILQDSSLPNQQLGLLAALRVLLQHVTPSDFAGRVVCAIGAEIITVFQSYGTLSVALPAKEAETHRTAACADCMKIVLLAYQQFSSGACDDDEMATFLVVVFQSFISVIRYNGLPNHPLPQAASDPAVGRMCAQAITHIARTTPLPFKSSMSKLSEHNRTVLEFAVRAEMSGYVTAAAQAPVKKKLNLKSFKK